jgi:DNA-binding CsgD family transcriptional regulator
MNTDPIRAPCTTFGALEAIASATSGAEMCAAVACLATALGMNRFMLLHLHGTGQDVIGVHDNLGRSPSLDEPWAKQFVARALASNRIPQLEELVDIPELRHAVSAMWQNGLTTTILVIGRESELQNDAALELMGMASLASNYASGALVAIQRAESPLPSRELECLVYAAAGCSAKETSRLLQLSPRTVEEYLLRCRERLGVPTTLAALATAVRRGWITFEEIDATRQHVSCRYAADRR